MRPNDRRYLKSHEWCKVDDGIATIGITDFAVAHLSDLVFLDLPAVGSSVEAATLLAIRMENLARIILDVARLGREVPEIPPDEIDSFRSVIERGVAAKLPKGDEWIWAQYVQLLEDSVGLPDD